MTEGSGTGFSRRRLLAGAAGLDAIGATALATSALATGGAQGTTGIGSVVLQRIGRGATTVLLARFSDPVACKSSCRLSAPTGSGYGFNVAAQQLLDEGMVGIVSKPYSIEQLSDAIAEALHAQK